MSHIPLWELLDSIELPNGTIRETRVMESKTNGVMIEVSLFISKGTFIEAASSTSVFIPGETIDHLKADYKLPHIEGD